MNLCRHYRLRCLTVCITASAEADPGCRILHSASAGAVADRVAAFRKGLEEGGFREGQNVTTEYRWADDNTHRLPALAENLSRSHSGRRCHGGRGSQRITAEQKTSDIPIVSVLGGDPAREGLVFSLARPRGNVTGVAFLTASPTAKRLELLLEPDTDIDAALPRWRRFVSPVIQADPYFKVIDLTARYANSGDPRAGRIRHGRRLDELRN